MLCHLMDKPETPSSDGIAVIESFVISLYSVSCTLTDVNQARQQKERHTKLDMYGANPSSPSKCSPSLSGWLKLEIGSVPSRTALPRAAKVMNVLISCGCTTSCTGKCPCYNMGSMCTTRCRCSGHSYVRSNPPHTPPSN